MITALLARFWPYIGLVVLSAGLYWQIGKTATARAENKTLIGVNQTLIGVNQTQLETIQSLQNMQQLTEVVLVAHAGKRETIYETREVIKTRIREVIANAPQDSCLSVDVDPLVLDCLVLGSSCEVADDTIKAASNADDGH